MIIVPDVFKELVATIPDFATDWTKQEKIAFVFWYIGMIGTPLHKKDDVKGFLRFLARYQGLDLGISAADIDGGKLFAELTDGRRRLKPLLERVGTGTYRPSEHAMTRFRKYEVSLKELHARSHTKKLEEMQRRRGDKRDT